MIQSFHSLVCTQRSKSLWPHKNLLVNVHRRQPQMSVNRWMDKQIVVHLYSGILLKTVERKELLVHATAWMNLKIMVLNERRQARVFTVWFHCQDNCILYKYIVYNSRKCKLIYKSVVVWEGDIVKMEHAEIWRCDKYPNCGDGFIIY